MIKLALRDPTDCVEFPVFPVEESGRKRELRGHVALAKDYNAEYVLSKMRGLHAVGIKKITIHTTGIDQGGLDMIACVSQSLGIRLNIENMPNGRTSEVESLKRLIEGIEKPLKINSEMSLRCCSIGVTLDVGHAAVNDSLDEYIRRFCAEIKSVHLYKIEENGHQPFGSYGEFEYVADKLITLYNCDWWVIEADNAWQMVEWFKRYRVDRNCYEP